VAALMRYLKHPDSSGIVDIILQHKEYRKEKYDLKHNHILDVMNLRLHDKTQIIYCNNVYSADFLKNRINLILSAISKHNLNINDRLIIFMDRSPDLVCAMLAAITLGVTYVPVSINTPKDRLDYIIQDSKVSLVITNEKYRQNFDHIDCILVEKISKEEGKSVVSRIDDNNVAYIIYTSGTTGKPKGVMIEVRSLANLIEGIVEKINFQANEIIGFFTDIAFDISFIESVLASCIGMTIILANDEEQSNPRKLAELIKNNQISILQLTPSRLRQLYEVDNSLSCMFSVKKFLVGGEVFTPFLFTILRNNSTAKIYNLYGPTETTVWSTIAELNDNRNINIGKAIANTEIYIIDSDNNVVQDGERGEIAISGMGVGVGYVNDLELTNRKFVYPNFLNGKRLYKTGDLGRINCNGDLEYIGRIDNQVKVNGYRIELEEIESIINEYYKFNQSFVIYDEGIRVVIMDALLVNINELRSYLMSKLPKYMMPVSYHVVKDFVYTLSGKINKKGTYEEYVCVYDKPTVIKTEFENESKIIEIIGSVIPNKKLNRECAIFELDIDSISWIRILVEIEKAFSIRFEDEMLSQRKFQNIDDLILYVERRSSIV
jgi:amino acid adenylation domain-containing protein